MSAKTRAYAVRVDIAAPLERVWSALTTAAALQKWLSPAARVKLAVGGIISGSLDREREFAARVDLLDVPRRIRMVHLRPEELPQLEAVIVDDLLVEPREGVTIVRMLGSGFPSEAPYQDFYARRQRGWRRSLARLKVFLEKNLDQPKENS